MFKFSLGIVFIVAAILLTMTGVGIILAIPLGLIGLFLAGWGFFALIGSGAKSAVKAAKKS